MDSTQFPQGAVAAPPAADPTTQQPGTGLGTGAPGDSQQIGIPPGTTIQQGAPDAAATPLEPTGSSSPSSSAAPALPYTLEQIQQLEARARQFDQVTQELTQLARQQEQSTREQAAATEAENRLNQAYQLAERMEPPEALTFLRNFQTQERARYEGQMRQIRTESEQQAMQMVAQVAAPLYAQDLAKQHGLPPEYAQRLAMLPPQQMDIYVPVLKREHEASLATQNQLKQVLAELDQLKRNGQAQALATSGAHDGGNAGVSPVLPGTNGQGPVPGSREHLLSQPGVARLLGIS